MITLDPFYSVREYLDALDALRFNDIDFNEYIDLRSKLWYIDIDNAVTHKFCGSCNRIRLTSEGMIKPCLQYDTGVDLRKILRAEDQTDEELREALQSAVFRKPSGHRFSAPGTGEGKDNEGNETAAMPLETREMSQIGG